MFTRWFGRRQSQEEAEAEYERAEPVDCVWCQAEDVGGQLCLRIPLSAGGEKLVECARGISRIEGDYLVVDIPTWLAEKLSVTADMMIVVGRKGRRFVMWTDKDQLEQMQRGDSAEYP